jgi:hypothetical protein
MFFYIIMCNSTEIGLPDDPDMNTPIKCISNSSNEKSYQLLDILLDEHLVLNII